MKTLSYFTLTVKVLPMYIFVILTQKLTDGWMITISLCPPRDSSRVFHSRIKTSSYNGMILDMSRHDGKVSYDEDEKITFGLAPDESAEEFTRYYSTETSSGEDEMILIDAHEKDDNRLERLAKYLVQEKDGIVTGRRIAVIGSSWISSLLAQLGASKVMVCDDEEYHGAKCQLLLRTHQMNPQNNPMYVSKEQCQIQFMGTLDIEISDAEVILLTTTSPDLINDPFVNDILRRTDAPIFMDRERMDDFCYHARIQEGANITLW